MELQKCYEERKLRKGRPKLKWAQDALKAAYSRIDVAEKSFKAGVYEFAFVSAYTAMFHGMRAVLFRDGIIEKSHYCMIRYFLDRYSTKVEKKYIYLMDEYRERRHAVLYSMDSIRVSEEEAAEAIENARQFLHIVENLLE